MATASILIQSLIRRAGGSKIDLYGKQYHFKPENDTEDARHVCAVPVEDAAAIHRFKQIPEGFTILADAADLPAAPKAPSGQTVHADQAAPAADAPALIQKAPVEPVWLENGEDRVELTAMTREQLNAFAKDNFEIKVHHKWSDDTVIQKILEAARGAD